ncbi:MAG: hypothetical protein KatS3mg087_0279 [Patescibacteria group bacterium]|nr:MAG: hypothetical protein KatS3mg087_0279 [Patescibacteria group bacterium]
MIEYRETVLPELSAAQVPNGTIYHLKGAYQLHEGSRIIVPVNRSYAPDINGDRELKKAQLRYRKNKLIHEDAKQDSAIEEGELLVDVYGKPLLFLQNNGGLMWYSSHYEENSAVSSASRKLADTIKEGLLHSGFSNEYRLGVYGSHQPSLNGVDSDLDLIAWVKWDIKDEFTARVAAILQQGGYRSSKETGKDAEYAARYSKRLNIPVLAGWYLAHKRMRWMSQNGVSTSLQCLNAEYDHTAAKQFLKGVNELWEGEEVSYECNVLAASSSYNFPKVWKVEADGRIFDVISFSWTHQGMGDDNGRFGSRYIFQGSKVTNNYGEFLYLRGEDHYLLPKDLL